MTKLTRKQAAPHTHRSHATATLSRRALSAAVSTVSWATGIRAKNHTLGAVRVTLHPECRLSLCCTDSESVAHTTVSAETYLPSFDSASILLDAKILTHALKTQPATDDITITLSDDGATARIGTATLPVMPPHPDIRHSLPTPTTPLATITSPRAEWLATHAAVAHAISTEQNRYYLNGIALQTCRATGRLVAVATDGHRLVEYAPTAVVLGVMPDIIVPQYAAAQITKIITATKPSTTPTITIDVDDTRSTWHVGSTTVSVPHIEGSYPDYERCTPTGQASWLTLDRASLHRASRAVALPMPPKHTQAVACSVMLGRLSLRASHPDHGTRDADLAAQADGAPFPEIGLNRRYLESMADSAPGATLTLGIIDDASPILLTCPGHPQYRAVLVPMRV